MAGPGLMDVEMIGTLGRQARRGPKGLTLTTPDGKTYRVLARCSPYLFDRACDLVKSPLGVGARGVLRGDSLNLTDVWGVRGVGPGPEICFPFRGVK